MNSINSKRNYNWRIETQDESEILNIKQKLDLTDIVARVAINRGMGDVKELSAFLNPSIAYVMPDPCLMKDMDVAIERLIAAIMNNEKIAIFGDYDVDGIASAAILYRFFGFLDIKPIVYIPDRFKDGYGPSHKQFKQFQENGVQLIVTVDCGTSAFVAMKDAKNLGLDVIVLDHHMPEPGPLPEVCAIINPNRVDDDFPYKAISASAVTFLFVIAVRRRLRELGWFENGDNRSEPNLKHLLDLVALGTVCDIMPMHLFNRALVREGLGVLRLGLNVGLKVMHHMLGNSNQISYDHLGYVFGPRINAGGRIGESHVGFQLLVTVNEIEARRLSLELESLNSERKALESMALKEMILAIEGHHLSDLVDVREHSIVLCGSWHMGVIGILAGRAKNMYHRPVFVVTELNDGTLQGSARSVEGVDLGLIIAMAKNNNLIIKGGGHKMAAGFALEKQMFSSFSKFIGDRIEEALQKSLKNREFFLQARDLRIDAILSIGAINHELVKEIENLGPFGEQNTRPRFLIKNVIISRSQIVGGSHVMMFVKDRYRYCHRSIKCIIFKSAEEEIGKFVLSNVGATIDVVGVLVANNIDSSRVEIIVDDIAEIVV